jgi:DNA-binding NarL/FixJ family response regulator
LPGRNDFVLTEQTAAEALGVLTPREQAICLGYLRGLTESQIGREQRLSRPAIATHLSRARRKLCGVLGVPFRASERERPASRG